MHRCTPTPSGGPTHEDTHRPSAGGTVSGHTDLSSCPQALAVLPQRLEEVLVVVGGRALEEDEEGGEEPAPRSGNFAFYDTKARE